MQKRFQKNEIAEVADEFLRAIFDGENIFDLLKKKGATVEGWYDIRRWIKSNRPEAYMNIPFQLRREMPEKQEVVTLNKADRPVVTVAAEAIEKPTETLKVEDKHGEHTFKLYGEEKKPDELDGFVPVEKRRGRPPKNKNKEIIEEKVSGAKETVGEPKVTMEKPKVKMMILTVGSEHFIFRNQTGKIEITMSGNNSIIVPKEHIEELIVTLAQAVEMFKEGNNGRPE